MTSFQQADQIPFLDYSLCSIKHNPMKRIFDLVFSMVVMTLGLPLFFLIALTIKCTSRGGVIYAQERVGRGGKAFRCYKFRTMYVDAEKRLEEILSRNSQLKKEWSLTRKLKRDPRITWIGSFLRKTSLDELPQFWNVFKGDLSVVGPRPVLQTELEEFFGASANKILSIRPGLTGLWQVSGRNNLTYQKRVALDLAYVKSQSILLDIKLIIKTVPQMIVPKGAY
ncbi:MAG: sugar transferase [Chlamydiales bacterium]|nr:sugar transferase [Chlamydiia bacterium]MCP5508097.1 sugar transferase [Chlamydiales bacterium]